MSYCRFSTDDFNCDLYCYESDAGYQIHVAAVKPVFKEPLPPHIEFVQENLDAWLERHNTVIAMLEHCERKPLGLPHDGESFAESCLEDFLERLKYLRELGYRFPDYVLDDVQEEIEFENGSNG